MQKLPRALAPSNASQIPRAWGYFILHAIEKVSRITLTVISTKTHFLRNLSLASLLCKKMMLKMTKKKNKFKLSKFSIETQMKEDRQHEFKY